MTAATTTRPPRTTTAGPRPRTLAEDLAAGAVAGQVAGLIMLLVVSALFALTHQGLLFPQVLGRLVFGPTATEGLHLPALFLGTALHLLGPCLVWGLAFGALAWLSGARFGGQLSALAIVVGVTAQLVDVYVVLPWLLDISGQPDFWTGLVPGVWSWMYHLLFGLGLLYAYPWAATRFGPRP